MINCVEGGGKVEQRQSSKVSAIYRSKNVSQNLQNCRFRRMMGAVGRLQVGHQVGGVEVVK
jgi:hypothetical protein